MREELSQSSKAQIVPVGTGEDSLNGKKPSKKKTAVRCWRKCDLLQARKAASPLVGMIPARIKNTDLESTPPMITASECSDNVLELI